MNERQRVTVALIERTLHTAENYLLTQTVAELREWLRQEREAPPERDHEAAWLREVKCHQESAERWGKRAAALTAQVIALTATLDKVRALNLDPRHLRLDKRIPLETKRALADIVAALAAAKARIAELEDKQLALECIRDERPALLEALGAANARAESELKRTEDWVAIAQDHMQQAEAANARADEAERTLEEKRQQAWTAHERIKTECDQLAARVRDLELCVKILGGKP